MQKTTKKIPFRAPHKCENTQDQQICGWGSLGNKLTTISIAQNFKSALKLQFPAIWKLLVEFGVQIPLGSKPRKLFQSRNNLVVAGNHLFIPENEMFNYEKQIWKIQRGFLRCKLT
jgi:hypothetical protein